MNFAEQYEARRVLALGKGGLGSLFSGGNLGGILGSLAGGALDAFGFPEAGIPLAVATGAGGALGSTIGGVASGEPFGKALTGGLESGAISGALTGVGEGLTTGNVLAAPGAAATGPLGNLFGAAAGDATGGLGTAPVTPVTATPLSAGGAGASLAPAAAAGGAPAAGVGAAALPDIGAGVGSSPPEIGGALNVGPPLPLGTITGGGGGGPSFFGSVSDAGAVSNAGLPTPLQSTGASGPTTNLVTGLPGSGSDTAAAGGLGAFDASGNPVATGSPTATDFAGGAAPGAGSKILSYIEQNPGLLLAGGGLAEALFKGNSIPGIGALKTQAGLESTQGNQNLQALQTGQLPAGAQAAIDEAQQAAKATEVSTFDRLGMAKSTSEAQAIAGIEQQAAAQKFTDLSQVSQLGLNEVNAANNLYTMIMNTELAKDQETQQAIARLAAALGGGTGRTTTTTATA